MGDFLREKQGYAGIFVWLKKEHLRCVQVSFISRVTVQMVMSLSFYSSEQMN